MGVSGAHVSRQRETCQLVWKQSGYRARVSSRREKKKKRKREEEAVLSNDDKSPSVVWVCTINPAADLRRLLTLHLSHVQLKGEVFVSGRRRWARCGANGHGILFKYACEAAGRRPAHQLPSAIAAALWVSHVEGFVCVNGCSKTAWMCLCMSPNTTASHSWRVISET